MMSSQPPPPTAKARPRLSISDIDITQAMRNEGISPGNSNYEDAFFGARVVNQADLERQVATKADQEMFMSMNEDDKRRLRKTRLEKVKLEVQLKTAKEKMARPNTTSSVKEELKEHIHELNETIGQYADDIADIITRIQEREAQAAALTKPKQASEMRKPNENEREFLIRTGKITPFNQIPGMEQRLMIDLTGDGPGESVVSAGNLRRPGFEISSPPVAKKNLKRRQSTQATKAAEKSSSELSELSSLDSDDEDVFLIREGKRRRVGRSSYDADFAPEKTVRTRKLVRKYGASGSDTSKSDASAYEQGTTEDSDDDCYVVSKVTKKRKQGSDYYESDVAANKRKRLPDGSEVDRPVRLDDGDEKLYQCRLKDWVRSRSTARKQSGGDEHDDDLQEWEMPHPTIASKEFTDGEYRLPGDIHPSLFPYQNVCVQWLWELHRQKVGGILADEMGLGKTVMMISFLAGLHHSGLLDKPVLIVAPGAVLSQWASEFHLWWPALRVAILHSSGSGMLTSHDTNAYTDEDSEIEEYTKPKKGAKKGTRNSNAAKVIVDRAFKLGHVLLTTYEGLATYEKILLQKEWGYAILDEGHKIRNPDAQVSLNCKRLKTPHRIILSGTPIQNNLVELWSIFDFVYPGCLGTLPTFKQEFEIPIRIGGYKNASNIQVQTATQCALSLKATISPYLLRRMKADVAKDLPQKDEKVLFCQLTNTQRRLYKDYIGSAEVRSILDGKLQSFAGIAVLRKICCHPHLADSKGSIDDDDEEHSADDGPQRYRDYGKEELSGKMLVTKGMLIHWKMEGHRTLLFSQSTQVLDMLERNISRYPGFKCRRMDGKTPITQRQLLVDEFNNDPSIDVFLLTTRVGGLGLNLTGADRVIIFDPDWNPSTDLQARERAWRIGQTKPVSVFRLLAAGTIEEKMYNRQLFKQHLSQKVLNNPEQRRFFHSDNLHDLFTYTETTAGIGTSTGAMFEGAETIYNQLKKSAKERTDEENLFSSMEGVRDLHDYTITGKAEKAIGERKYLEDIFSSSGVLSSVHHEALVSAANPEQTNTLAYANEIAARAQKRLQDSAKSLKGMPVGTLTWTGKNGDVGVESEPVRRSAAGLLASLQTVGVGAGGLNRPPQIHKNQIRGALLQVFRRNYGTLKVSEIRQWCQSVGLDTPAQKADIMTLLRDVAAFDKKNLVWNLKK
ncbi:SNF2 family N-terminal domain-containing protein [Pyronema domesticum]|nr:SNF2 family N-terminal domain-containing protein [Pyronema domesticum]